MLVFARAPAGQEFAVAVDTTDNEASLKGDASGKVEGVLHYGKPDFSISKTLRSRELKKDRVGS